jgi:hypothetical protein
MPVNNLVLLAVASFLLRRQAWEFRTVEPGRQWSEAQQKEPESEKELKQLAIIQ